jgi:uncharacterized membrane protein
MTVATLYEWLVLAHVLAAMVWLGGLFALTALAWRVLAARDDAATLGLAASLGTIGPLVFAPAVVVLFGAGIGMVADSPAWTFGQTWVRLALAVFAAVFVLGAVFQSRAGIRAGRAAAAGDAATAGHELRRWALGNVAVLALLLLAVCDMVFKPGL